MDGKEVKAVEEESGNADGCRRTAAEVKLQPQWTLARQRPSRLPVAFSRGAEESGGDRRDIWDNGKAKPYR